MIMKIRKATFDDFESINEIYEKARFFMREHGNATQWGMEYPPKELIKADIENGIGYVCEVDGKIEGVFAFFFGQDSTYQNIYNGAWIDESDGGIVHRVASSGRVRGVGSFCLKYACEISDNVKIDTHRDNYVMRNLLEKNGFVQCGTIYVADGSPRVAYQWIKNNTIKTS